jgi:hypothetical protein
LDLVGFIRQAAGEIASISCTVLEAIKLIRGRLGGRWLDEVVERDETAVSMLLGGLEVSFRGDPYGQHSLARFYRDIVGVSVSHPRLVALRLDDGLDLVSAARGVKVRAFETRFSKLITQMCSLSRSIASTVEIESVEGVLEEPEWLPQRITDLLNTLMKLVPPYSVESIVVLAVAQGLPSQLVRDMPYIEDLTSIGVRPVNVDNLEVYNSTEESIASKYACLIYTGWKLFQLREINQFYNLPDPLAIHVQNTWTEVQPETLAFLEQLSLSASTLQCIEPPIKNCNIEPPCLPQGYRLVKLKAEATGNELHIHSTRITIEALAETVAHLFTRGLAWLKLLNSKNVELAFVYTPYPPKKTVEQEQMRETFKLDQQTHIPTRVGPPGSPNPHREPKYSYT